MAWPRKPRANLLNLRWPSFDEPVYVDVLPVWGGDGYYDPATGVVLPSWEQALDQVADGDRAAHVLRFGSQLDIAGIIAPSTDADRAIRFLTKYLAKSIATTYVDADGRAAREYEDHVRRLQAELLFLPCSERCPNWLRFGVQPAGAVPGLRPGQCDGKAHDREHLGLGGRRVLVSRQWSGKTLLGHRADRAAVVRAALLESGIVAPEIERLAASVTLPDGRPRFVWTDLHADPVVYARVILESVAERSQWRTQYEQAKQAKGQCTTRSATDGDPDG